MSDKSQKNTKRTDLRYKIIHHARRVFQDWDIKIMSYVMLVVVMVAVIAATVAWFFYYRAVAFSDLKFTTASSDSLKLEVKQGTQVDGTTENFVEVHEGEDDSVLVDLDMPVFDNVEQYEVSIGTTTEKKQVNKMAPGVYGSLTIRLTPLSKEINHYKITPAALLTYMDQTEDTLQEDGSVTPIPEKKGLQALARGHILFFGKRIDIPEDADGMVNVGMETKPIIDFTHNQKYVFDEQIDQDTPLEGDLSWNEDTLEGETSKITVYWYWPYEYTNLSSAIQDAIRLPADDNLDSSIPEDPIRLLYFDQEKMREIVQNHISWDEIQLYDYADTRIGTDVKSIKLHLKVDGYHATAGTEGTASKSQTTE